MNIDRLADILALFAAIACWRISRPAAYALLAAFAASLLYLAAPWEPLRLVSALVGLVGAIEFGRHRPKPPSRHYAWFGYRGAPVPINMPRGNIFAEMPRRAWIGLLLLASMTGDGAALLAYRAWQEWVLPVAQIVVCVAIAAIARWPERSLS